MTAKATAASPLVMEGSKIKLRLEENRNFSGHLVSIDWLRFTTQLHFNHDNVFPLDVPEFEQWFSDTTTDEFDKPETFAAAKRHAVQALWLAKEVCDALGHGFNADTSIKAGKDFYKYRISIMRENHECGWVGFLSSTTSKSKDKQDNTLHVNLYGHACTFAQHGWHKKMQVLIEAEKARITRVDFAMDSFNSEPEYLLTVKDQYQHGLMNVNGKEPKMNMVGCWRDDGKGHSRSIYFGSKEAGKQTNVYEKGHQLFGPDSGSNWTRVEVRYGNKLRVIPADVLTDPDRYFAGASDWHAQQLSDLKEQLNHTYATTPEAIKTTPRLSAQTIKAEVYRNAKWLANVAAPSIAMAFEYLGDEFLELVTNQHKPGRLRKFSSKEIGGVFSDAFRSAVGMSPAQTQRTPQWAH